MKTNFSRYVVASLSVLSLIAGPVWAQDARSADTPVDDEIYDLDPFSVTPQTERYRALDTLGGARVRTDLADTPSSISVVTPQLMQDLGVTDAQSLLIYTTNTEVSGLGGNFSGISTRGFGVVGAAEGSRLSNPAGVNRSRGLTAMDSTRNYFLSEIPWDAYNISRVDISRGPNSFLFGVGSPSGISNVSTNEANYNQGGSLDIHYKNFGSHREALDYNMVLIPKELAVRVDLVNNDENFDQKPAYNDSERAYIALRYDPGFLTTASTRTKITANYEHGEVDSNNPRMLPPIDRLTGYFDGVNQAGYNPFTFAPDASNADPSASPWVTNEDIHYAWGNAVTFWWDATTGQLMKAGQSGVGGVRADGNSVAGFNGVSNVYNIYTGGFARHAIASNFRNPNLYPGAYDRTVNYLDQTLSDPSIFDFYNLLIDGDNKREWQNWDAFNLSAVQSLFKERLVLQAVATYEEYERGSEGPLSGYNSPYISIDLNSHLLTYPTWLPGAETNPNLGRPFIGSDYAGSNTVSYITHENYQVTAAYSLRAEDLFNDSLLTRIFGHQEFTSLGGRYITDNEDRNWQMYATDPAFGVATGRGSTLTANNLNWVSYLGPSFQGKTTASGAYLSNITTALVPYSRPVTVFDGTWTAGAGVDPAAPWTNPRPDGTVTWTQLDNPANYAGYQARNVSILNSRDNRDRLYTNGNIRRQTLDSGALLYQGYFWDEAIIPSFGWRRDKVLQQGNQAKIDATTGVADMDYSLTDKGASITTTSTSYGLAVHLDRIFKNAFPDDTNVSLYYFHGSNQTPKVRYAIDGSPLEHEQGETDDYSVQVTTFKGRLTMRLGYFKTVDKHAAASYGQPLGAQGWLIDSLPSWTLTFAASGLAAANTPASELPQDMQWNSWLWSWATDPANQNTVNQLATAMQTDFAEFFPQSYWDQYGLPVDVDALKRGDWVNVVTEGRSPFPWNINNSHLIHGAFPTIDQDLESKGFELEATVRPLKNWDITFNASKVEAYQTGLGAAADRYLNGLAQLYLETPIGLTPQWGNINSPVSDQFMSGLWAPYLTQVALTGSDQPELRKWNFKIITNYNIEEGALKGVNIGGAFRWASKPIIGYGIKEDMVWGEQAWISDVKKPIYGDDDAHFDLWIGYQRRLNDKLDWRIQLNLRNVGEDVHLVPIAVQPDGTVAQQRIENGMTFDLSSKFMF